jgi:hypothetical protein
MRAHWWLLGLLACDAGRPTPEDFDRQVADFVAESGVTFADCGVATSDEPCDTTTADPALTCLQDAWATCTASRYEQHQTTIEGDPIRIVLFVYPQGVNCSVVQFVDATQDAFGSGEIEQSTCDGLVTSPAGTCPSAGGDGCIADCDDGSDCG